MIHALRTFMRHRVQKLKKKYQKSEKANFLKMYFVGLELWYHLKSLVNTSNTLKILLHTIHTLDGRPTFLNDILIHSRNSEVGFSHKSNQFCLIDITLIMKY